jgi:Lipase (class 3)
MRHKKTWAAALLLLALATMAGWGALVTAYAALPRNDKGNDTAEVALATDRLLGELAQRFGLMALFAEVVYRNDLTQDERDEQGCDYLDPAKVRPEHLAFGMPQADAAQGRWRRWLPPAGDTRFRPCLDAEGLYYETYVHEDAQGRIDEAVIAFRGTENRPGQFLADWSSNLKAAIGIEPGQYALAQEQVLALLEGLRRHVDPELQHLKIYAVGHSLGGGLAQQAGYLSKDIAEVYTFNTSPVTNWSQLRLKERVKNAFPIIHRVYHGGEILEKVRFVTTSVTKARYGRHDIGLQLDGRSSFGGHSMKIIACGFALQLASQPDLEVADHAYPLSYVKEVVLRQTADSEAARRHLICAPEPKDPA